MTNETGSNNESALREFRFGEYFAQLTEHSGCEPIRIEHDFWQNGIANLPPGRLISLIDSACDWDTWERHPHGAEFILQMSGELELILDYGGRHASILLRQNDFAIVPPGVWHTANVPEPGAALYITPGEGTQNRTRV
jgi:mannose-6-phosphate isomerase-like protein (cupin superfamily)